MKLFHKTARWFLKKCHPGKPWSAGKYGKIIVSYFSHKLLICLTRKSMKTLSKRLLARKLTQIHLIINSDRRQLNSYSPHNFLRPITRKWIKNRSSYCPHNLLRPVTRKWTETSSKLEACWKNKGHNLHKLIAMSDLNNSDGNDIFGPMPLAFWFSTVFGTKMMLLRVRVRRALPIFIVVSKFGMYSTYCTPYWFPWAIFFRRDEENTNLNPRLALSVVLKQVFLLLTYAGS